VKRMKEFSMLFEVIMLTVLVQCEVEAGLDRGRRVEFDFGCLVGRRLHWPGRRIQDIYASAVKSRKATNTVINNAAFMSKSQELAAQG